MLDVTERKRAEDEIRRRAEELRAANEEPERFNRAMVGRELHVLELKREVNELHRQAGRPEPYKAEPDATDAGEAPHDDA